MNPVPPAAPAATTEDQLWKQASKDRAASSPVDDAPVVTTPPGAAASSAPAPAKEPAAAAPASPTPAPSPDDPFAGLPEPTRKLIEGLQANDARRDSEMRTLRGQVDTAHGTIGSLKQDLQKSQERLTTMQPTVDAAATAAKAADAEKLIAERKRIEAARTKLADLLEPEELDLLLPLPKEKPAEPAPAAAASATPSPTPTPTPAPAPAQPVPSQRASPAPEVVAALHEAMEIAHPGWLETRKSPEFKAWFAAAPAETKALQDSWSAKDTAKIFDGFKKHQADAAEVTRLAAERDGRLRRGEGPTGRGSAAPGAPASGPDALWEQAKRDREKQRQAA